MAPGPLQAPWYLCRDKDVKDTRSLAKLLVYQRNVYVPNSNSKNKEISEVHGEKVDFKKKISLLESKRNSKSMWSFS